MSPSSVIRGVEPVHPHDRRRFFVTVSTEEQAIEVLLGEQVRAGGAETQPASGDTRWTDAGWAFFNVNGYLGTVTKTGEVIYEPELDTPGGVWRR